MYGSWFGVMMSVVGVILLLVAAAATAWTPLFAFAIFAAIGAVMLVVAAMRRSAEDARGGGRRGGGPKRSAAPVGGEGSRGSDNGRGAPASESERTPEPESAGIWGER
jgi:membrane protein implicated in regulation of membrane protease activity